MSVDWHVYGADTIAYRLDKAELPGWLRKTITVGPGEGVIILRDGKAEQVLTESGQNVQGMLEAMTSKLLGWLIGQQDLQVIFVDLNPLCVPVYLGNARKQQQSAAINLVSDEWPHAVRASQVTIEALTADREVVNAECVITLGLNTAEPARIAALLKGYRGLSRWDLAALIRDEVVAKVLVPHLATVKAEEIRGNRDLVSRIRSWARAELEPSLQAYGLHLIDFVINWGLTETDKQKIADRCAELQEVSLKFEHQRRLAEMQRNLEVEKVRLENLQQLKLVEAQGGETLKGLYLAGQLHRDALSNGRRVDAAKVDAEVKLIQLEVQKKEGQLRLEQGQAEQLLHLEVEDKRWGQQQEQRLAQIDAEDKELRGLIQLQIQMATAKHERRMTERRLELDSQYRTLVAELSALFEQRKLRLEMAANNNHGTNETNGRCQQGEPTKLEADLQGPSGQTIGMVLGNSKPAGIPPESGLKKSDPVGGMIVSDSVVKGNITNIGTLHINISSPPAKAAEGNAGTMKSYPRRGTDPVPVAPPVASPVPSEPKQPHTPIDDTQVGADIAACVERDRFNHSIVGYLTQHATNRIKDWEQAAHDGVAGAQWLLGNCLKLGIGIDLDSHLASRWLRKACIQKFAPALVEYGRELLREKWRPIRKGSEAVWKATDESLKSFKRAAELGYANGQYWLARLYEDKYKDPTCQKWYKLAAMQGHRQAAECALSGGQLTPDERTEIERLLMDG